MSVTMTTCRESAIRKVMGSALAAESVPLLVKALLKSEPQGGSDWRSRLETQESW